jgi:hypothetical protein
VPIERKPYNGKYPSAAQFLMNAGIASTPRQSHKELKWADALEINYTLKDLTPANFRKYSDSILLLAYQEAMRYNEYQWKFAAIDVKLGRLKKGRDLPDIATFQAHMHNEPDILIYGPGYEVPQTIFLKDQIDKILDIVKRYGDRINKQTPFKVVRLTISIREPKK